MHTPLRKIVLSGQTLIDNTLVELAAFTKSWSPNVVTASESPNADAAAMLKSPLVKVKDHVLVAGSLLPKM